VWVDYLVGLGFGINNSVFALRLCTLVRLVKGVDLDGIFGWLVDKNKVKNKVKIVVFIC